MKWFYGHVEKNVGSPLCIDDIAYSSNSGYIIFCCCEELELLSREYSNDEGGDSSIARGPQVDPGTENPDFLQKMYSLSQRFIVYHYPRYVGTVHCPRACRVFYKKFFIRL